MGTKDSAALEKYRQFLSELALVTDYIRWQRGAWERLLAHLPNVGPRMIHELMRDHARNAGKIDQVEETRPEYVSWKFHYDLRMPISGQKIYIETVFDGDHEDLEDCLVYVVNIHPA